MSLINNIYCYIEKVNVCSPLFLCMCVCVIRLIAFEFYFRRLFAVNCSYPDKKKMKTRMCFIHWNTWTCIMNVEYFFFTHFSYKKWIYVDFCSFLFSISITIDHFVFFSGIDVFVYICLKLRLFYRFYAKRINNILFFLF